MGHGKCGGCKAALSHDLKDAAPGEGGFVHNWIRLLDPAREIVVGEYGDDRSRDAERAMEQEGVKVSLANLRTFPCVRKRKVGQIEAGRQLLCDFGRAVAHSRRNERDLFARLTRSQSGDGLMATRQEGRGNIALLIDADNASAAHSIR